MVLDVSNMNVTELQLNDLLADMKSDTVLVGKGQQIFSNKRLKEIGEELEAGFYQSDFGKVKVETI